MTPLSDTLQAFSSSGGIVLAALTIAAVLLTPGPTNTLLFLAAAKQGVRRSLPLIGAELLGYCFSIAGWCGFLGLTSALFPQGPSVGRALAAAYVAYLAVKMWGEANREHAQQARAVRGRTLFVSTLLNPKAFFFAATVFPPASAGATAFIQAYTLFVSLAIPIGVTWMTFGAWVATRGAAQGNHRLVHRGASLVLAVFSVSICASLFR
ncbi:MAG: LysE family transporter [Pseudomonadota bacterium]